MAKEINKCMDCGNPAPRGLRCRSCSKKGKNNFFYGKKHTDESKAKFVEAHKHRDKSTYKSRQWTDEEKARIGKQSKERWANIDPEVRQKWIQSWISAGCKRKDTKIESFVQNILSEIKIDQLERNKSISLYNVDFLINGKFVIECFGDYWHCNPKIYVKDFYNASLKMTAKDKWSKDKQKISHLKKAGYNVLVVWEKDIKSSPEIIRDSILEFLGYFS